MPPGFDRDTDVMQTKYCFLHCLKVGGYTNEITEYFTVQVQPHSCILHLKDI